VINYGQDPIAGNADDGSFTARIEGDDGMNTAKVMEDGDLRLPREVAEKFDVKPGDSVAVEMEADGTMRLYPKRTRIEDVCGKLHPPSGVHLTIEQMDEGIANAFRRGKL
jgi:antitoxin component of MazEF toxin-antitoxin module